MWVDSQKGESVHQSESSGLTADRVGLGSHGDPHTRLVVGLVAGGVVVAGIWGLGGWGFKGAWAGGGEGWGIRKARKTGRRTAREARGAQRGIRPARGGEGRDAAETGAGPARLSAAAGESGDGGSGAGSGTGGISKRAPSLEKRTYAVASRGRWLFLATTSGLIVLKKERNKPLKRVGGVVLPDSGNDVWVERDRLFMARGAHGLVALDIKRPAWPKVLGRVDTPGAAHSVAVKGRYAYVADGSGGLQVVDIKSPKRMAVVGSAKTVGYAWAVAVVRRRAYVAAGRSGLKVFDIRHPKRPRLVATVPVAAWMKGRERSKKASKRVSKRAPKAESKAGSKEAALEAALDSKGGASSRYTQARRRTQKLGRQARDVEPGPRGRIFVAGGTAGLVVVDIKAKTPKVMARVAVSDFARGVGRVGKARKRRVAVAHGQGGVSLVAATKRGGYSVVATTLTKRAANEVIATRIGGRETLVVAHDSDGVLLIRPPKRKKRESGALMVVGQWPTPKKKGKK